MKKIVLGLAISAGLIYLSLRNIRIEEIGLSLNSLDYKLLPAIFITLILIQLLRTYRWGLILSPLGQIAPVRLFSITAVGFLAIIALPVRLGELVRPYLVAKETGIRLSSALGTILVERVADSICLLMIALTLIFFIPLPRWLIDSGSLFAIMALGLLALMIFLVLGKRYPQASLRIVLNRLPETLSGRVDEVITNFQAGLAILSQEGKLLAMAALTVSIWLLHVLVIYLFFLSFNLAAPVIGAFVLFIILMTGIALPAAPGFLGTWHYATILALGLFDIAQPEALSFAVVHHAISIGAVILLGIIFLPFHLFTLFKLREASPRGTS